MGLFDRLKGALGMEQPTLEVTLEPSLAEVGDVVTVTVTAKGGGHAVKVAAVYGKLILMQPLDDEDEEDVDEWQKKTACEFRKDCGNVTLGAGESKTFTLEFTVPEAALPDEDYEHALKVVVALDCDGIDPKGEAEFELDMPEEDEDDEDEEDEDDDEDEDEDDGDSDNPYRGYSPETHPHALGDYVQRFTAMVDRLRAVPEIVVLTYNTCAPITEAELAEAESDLGYALPEELKQLYRQSNGLQLRWIRKSNENYDPGKHVPSDKLLKWDWAAYDYWPEDGVVMLQPLSELLHGYGEGCYYFAQSDTSGYDDEFYMGGEVPYQEFRERLKMFDYFSKYVEMTLYLDGSARPNLMVGNDHQASYDHTGYVDIGTYLEFLIARLGLVDDRRKYFERDYKTTSGQIYAPKAYWEGVAADPGLFGLLDAFPLCMEERRPHTINMELAHALGERMDDKAVAKRDRALEAHKEWAKAGGRVLRWEILQAAGLPMCIPIFSGAGDGHFATQNGRAHGANWSGAQMPYLGYPALVARGLNASGANLKFSMFNYSNLEGANFAGANLRATDFTGSNLRNANFQGADVAGTDFELCDLTGADFTGANTYRARFPGAILKGVVTNNPQPVAPAIAPLSHPYVELLAMLNAGKVDYLVLSSDGEVGKDLTLLPRQEKGNVDAFLKVLAEYSLGDTSFSNKDFSSYSGSIMELEPGWVTSLGNLSIGASNYGVAAAAAKEATVDGVTYRYTPNSK